MEASPVFRLIIYSSSQSGVVLCNTGASLKVREGAVAVTLESHIYSSTYYIIHLVSHIVLHNIRYSLTVREGGSLLSPSYYIIYCSWTITSNSDILILKLSFSVNL